jgi:hypothetical protein
MEFFSLFFDDNSGQVLLHRNSISANIHEIFSFKKETTAKTIL